MRSARGTAGAQPSSGIHRVPPCGQLQGVFGNGVVRIQSKEKWGIVGPAVNGSSVCNATELFNATRLLSDSAACPSGAPHLQLMGTVALSQVCVRYHSSHVNAVSDIVSLHRNHTQCTADLFGYNEYRNMFSLLGIIRQGRESDNTSSCRWRRLGLGLRFSSNNFFHQSFYAAAAHHALAAMAREDPNATFVPLGTGFPQDKPTRQWEYTLRSLSSAPAERMLEEIQQMLKSCTCFEQLVMTTNGIQIFSKTSRAYHWAYRRSSLMNVHAVMGLATSPLAKRASQDMLFIVRHTSRRVISNEEDVKEQALAAQPRIQFAAFEEMPITQQIALVSTASVLIGVHGQALAGYVLHLPADTRSTACVEIVPAQDRVSHAWSTIVPGLSNAAGVRYFGFVAAHSPGCYIDYLRQINCTAQTNPELCNSMVRKGLRSFQAKSVLYCNVTVNTALLLNVIDKAALATAVPALNNSDTGGFRH